MSKVKKLFSIIIFIGIICLLTNSSNAGTQDLNDLEYDIQIMNNGNVMITEYWDINMYDVNTLFKTFNRDSKFKELSEVSVTEVDAAHNPINIFQNSGEYKYHEDKNFFHATDDDNGCFEIAWGVSAEGSEHRYFKISYIIKDCINVYEDCAEFYWKIIGEDWEIESDRVHGKVTLPTEVKVYEDFRVWAHGPLTGQILKDNSRICNFTVNNMPTRTFLELRIVFPTDIVPNATNIQKKQMLDNILKEEQRNADRANFKRKIAKSREKICNIAFAAISVLSGIPAILMLKNMKKLFDSSNKLERENVLNTHEYFRDIPDSKMSPVSAALLENGKVEKKNIFSALMMSLAQKKWISITPGQKKDDTKIKLNVGTIQDKVQVSMENRRELLTDDEQRTLDYLAKVGTEFSLKDFEKYTSRHQESFYNYLEKLERLSNIELKNVYKYIDPQYDKLKEKFVNNFALSTLMTMMIAAVGLGTYVSICMSADYKRNSIVMKLMTLVMIVYAINAIVAIIYSIKIPKYTEKGREERSKWKGLKKFMMEFSLMDEREVPELVLWEKYLVYATAFGIADKVIKQLKTRFPQLNDDNYVSSHYTCMYMASHSNLYHSSFNKSVSAAESYHAREVAASSYSSGSGGGGGFSSGGGGGRRRRWPEEDVKMLSP